MDYHLSRYMYLFFLIGLTLAGRTMAQETRHAGIDAQPLNSALKEFADHTGLQLVYLTEIVAGVNSEGAAAGLSADETLIQLLENTGLVHEYVNQHTVAIKKQITEGEQTAGKAKPAPRNIKVAQIRSPADKAREAATANNGPGEMGGGRNTVEEVVVTAQLREQKLTDVSISVSVLPARRLRDAGIGSSTEIDKVVPNVLISNMTGNGNPNIVIRGVSSGAAHFAVTPSPAALNIDGIYYTSNAFAAFQLFDLDRVEVLRGPQGTLYGRNTTAGTVNFHTAEPTEQATGFLEVTGASFERLRVEGALSGPLSDQVNARVAMLSEQSDGYIFNRISGEHVGGLDVIALRATLDVQPTDSTLIRISAHGFTDRSSASLYDNVGLNGVGCRTLPSHGSPVRPECRDDGAYSDDDGDPYTSEGNAVRDADNEQFGGLVTITHDAFFGLFVSQTSYDYLGRDYGEEQDGNSLQYIDISYHENFRQWNQELRLSSPDGNKFYWMLGAYYGGSTFDIGRHVPNAWRVLDIVYENRVEESSAALFAHMEIKLSDRVKLIAGLRNTWDAKESSVDNGFVTGTGVVNPLCDFATCHGDGNWSALSGKLGLDFKVSDELFMYGNYSRGFSSGGFPGGIIVNPANFRAYAPEYVDAYEVGLKTTLLNRSLSANFSAFYYDYTDRKEYTLLPATTVGGTDFVQVFTNSAKAEIYGAEAELTWRPAEHFWMNASAGYLETEYSSFPLPQGLPGAAMLDLTGNELPFAPRWTVYAAAGFEYPLPGGSHIGATADVRFRSGLQFNPQNSILVYEPAHTILGFALNWTSADERWDARAFIRNASDEAYRTFAAVGFGNVIGTYAPPRSCGVSVRYRFGAR